MAPNLVPSAMYENDLPSSEFSDDSFAKSKTIDSIIPLVDVVFENIPRTTGLGLQIKSKKLQSSNELDEVYDGDTVSSSSSGCGCCSRIPASPTSDVSAIEPLVDVSVDSVDPNIFYHPLAQCMDSESEPYIKNLDSFNTALTNPISSAKSSVKLRNVTDQSSYTTLRVTYLLVTLVIMLADGLQGTHLYVLYEGYGYSVAYLYCLGFATGGLLSPITGPLVDKIGRKKSAILYCCLEMLINYMEQFPYLTGLIICRMIGGFTTNLLSSVFETWLDTEYRRRGFAKEKYEIIMRDSVIISNMAAIFSGYLSHILANRYGTVGPFQGAVTCTTIALMVVSFVWTENYGVSNNIDGSTKNMMGYFKEAVNAFRNDRRMLIVGLLQSLTAGSIQIFVFLWAPTLRLFATSAPKGTWGLDQVGEPAYGLIFGAFMGAGVLGGLVAPRIRTFVSTMLSPIVDDDAPIATVEIEGEGNVPIRPMAVEFLASFCYFLSALLLFVPSLCQDGNELSFTNALVALLLYEFLIGIFMPCEGVIRSLYFPTSARASIMTLPRIFVNVAVAIGVVSTNFISLKTAFFAVGCLMAISSILQISLISKREWSSLFSRMDRIQSQVMGHVRSVSLTLKDIVLSTKSNLLSNISEVIRGACYQMDTSIWDDVTFKAKKE